MTLAEAGHGLALIGTGVGDPNSMPVKGVELATACERRYLEGYTSMLGPDGMDALVEMVGEVEILRRGAIEHPADLLEEAKLGKVALLVVGDPLQATTHIDLILRCQMEGVPTEVVHAASITTVISGGLGLQNYRFGRQVTIAFPVGDYLPTSPLEMLCENRWLGLHSLVLFDLDPTGMGEEAPTPMTPSQAVDVLEKMAQKLLLDLPVHLLPESSTNEEDGRRLLHRTAVTECLSSPISEWFGIMCSDLGTSMQRTRRGVLADLAGLKGGTIHCLVIPGKMHSLEVEAVEGLHGPV